MSERIQTEYRDALHHCTTAWSLEGTQPVEAYYDLTTMLGQKASSYTDYLGTAITAGGYKRDTALSYGEVVAKNSEYALDMADELHRSGALNIHASIDAVALGKIKGWTQSDYLLFFFTVMSRPSILDRHSLTTSIEKLVTSQRDFSLDVFNDETLTNEERIPHYLGFARGYWETVQNFSLRPIQRMVELLDWDMTLGGRAEEELARHMGLRVARPSIISYSNELNATQLDPLLRQKITALETMGAHVLTPSQQPALGLQDITL